jgi:hypothetical protein
MAVENYNSAALVLSRPAISVKDVLDFIDVGEFDLLRLSRFGIQEKEWAHTANRTVTNQWLKIRRAREELARVRVEARRLWTYMHDEERALGDAINRLECKDDDIVTMVHTTAPTTTIITTRK